MSAPASGGLPAIRSYVRREGRFTLGQRRALEQHWPRFGIDLTGSPVVFADSFPRPGPLCLEVGCGTGEVLVSLSKARPYYNYLGVEVYRPGLGRLLRALADQPPANVRLVAADVSEVLVRAAYDPWLERALIFFPDPWPKKRHHKRRLINADFAARLSAALRPQGQVFVATDWHDYAEQILLVMQGAGLRNMAGAGRFAPRPRWRPLTRYEQRARGLGHTVFDLAFCRG